MVNLFVYGIFLDLHNRVSYGMSGGHYETVRDYATFGSHIVQAVKIPDSGLALTGLLVNLPEDYDWRALDTLEGGYDRIQVITTSGKRAYMYARPEKEDDNGN